MSTIIGPGVNKARILKGAANNICLILAVATAALTCHVVDDIEPRKTLSHLYYGIFTALLITDIVAVAVHHYLINRHVARLMYKKP
uniref:Uncharacterized protein n=1 Tax=Babesia bovis TaxID=5865 RepID=S6B8W2_BABBO|nr:hypothetical protein [Babesia bovis]